MKAIIFTALALVLALLLTPITTHADGEITVIVDGNSVSFPDQSPITINDRVFVPLAGVFQVLGFTPQWDGAAQIATLIRGGDMVVVYIGRYTFSSNGVRHNLDVPAQIINNRTMIPIGPLVRSLGYTAEWDGPTQTATIITGATTTGTTTSGNVAIEPQPTPSVPAVPNVPQPPEQTQERRTASDISVTVDGISISARSSQVYSPITLQQAVGESFGFTADTLPRNWHDFFSITNVYTYVNMLTGTIIIDRERAPELKIVSAFFREGEGYLPITEQLVNELREEIRAGAEREIQQRVPNARVVIHEGLSNAASHFYYMQERHVEHPSIQYGEHRRSATGSNWHSRSIFGALHANGLQANRGTHGSIRQVPYINMNAMISQAAGQADRQVSNSNPVADIGMAFRYIPHLNAFICGIVWSDMSQRRTSFPVQMPDWPVMVPAITTGGAQADRDATTPSVTSPSSHGGGQGSYPAAHRHPVNLHATNWYTRDDLDYVHPQLLTGIYGDHSIVIARIVHNGTTSFVCENVLRHWHSHYGSIDANAFAYRMYRWNWGQQLTAYRDTIAIVRILTQVPGTHYIFRYRFGSRLLNELDRRAVTIEQAIEMLNFS